MMTLNKFGVLAILASAGIGFGCGDNNNVTDGDDNGSNCATPDAHVDGSIDAAPADTYKQMEQLARPAIAEALLISNPYLAGYNATAPTFAGVDPTTLNAVVGEAKTVLKAVYYGACFLNGAAGLTAATGLHPGGMTCAAVGTAVFGADGHTIDPAVATAASTYADAVFALFEPDVMRLDTSGPSEYLTLCGAGADAPLLCGGRLLTDDVIDITYDFLLAGAAIDANSPAQFRALVSDGVEYGKTAATSPTSLQAPDPSNFQQGHPAPSATFPYSPAPY